MQVIIRSSYLLKNIHADFLLQSICRAAAGELVMSPQMDGKLADAMRTPAKGNAYPSEPQDKKHLLYNISCIYNYLKVNI